MAEEKLNDLQDIILSDLYKTIPNTVDKAYQEDLLVYYIAQNNTYIPTIDFQRQMPETMQEYKVMIQESLSEWLAYNEVRYDC